MSISGALTVALTGLQTASTAAQVISGNISNANTPGYTAKTLDLQPVSVGASVGGVSVSGYSRVSDLVLSATLNSATTNASYFSTQNGYMTQVQSILDSSDNPPALSADLSNFQAAWTQYSANPSDPTLQQSVISTGQLLANTVNVVATETATLQTQVQSDLSTSVIGLNNAISAVQTLNDEVSTALANNQPAVDLEDQRDQAISLVAKYTNVTVLQRNNGQIALYTPGGTPLLDGQPQIFSVNSNLNGITNASGSDVTGVLTGGSLQAQTDFLSTTVSTANGIGVIGKINSQLTAFANMFVSPAAGGFADTYDSAATGSGEQASQFFTATVDGNGNITDLSSFAVNSRLINGTSTVKLAAATPVANTFTATNLAINTATIPPTTTNTFTANGISTTNQTYSGVMTAIISGFQQAANTINTQSVTATAQQTYYQNALSSESGVNTDKELVNLTNWENSYAASAHVISTLQSMMTTLQNMVQG